MKPAEAPSAAQAKADELEAAAVWVDIDSLVPWKGNPRHNERTVANLASSIKRFGFGSPIVARKADREIIAGHTRMLAAKKLGLKKVPVRFLDLDPVEAHLLAVADNKIPEQSSWDDQLLAETLAHAQGVGVNVVDGTGLSNAEVDALLNPQDEGDAGGEEEDDDGSGAKQAVISYTLVFDSDEQQQAWFRFIKGLKKQKPELETIGARLAAFLDEQGF